jgi:hypothetical protein
MDTCLSVYLIEAKPDTMALAVIIYRFACAFLRAGAHAPIPRTKIKSPGSTLLVAAPSPQFGGDTTKTWLK